MRVESPHWTLYRLFLSAVVIGVCGLVSDVLAQTRVVRYVNAAAGAGGNGTSWASAFRDLQDALSGATSTTDIWVAKGTYRPDRGTNQRSASFLVPAGTQLYGGFVGNETSVNQRNLSVRDTVLSGDIGLPGDNSDNSYHVVRFSAGAGSPKLDGFAITGGHANGAAYPDDSGGGILSDGATPTIESCTVTGNTAKFGGGMFAKSGAVTVLDSDFRSNTGVQDGGAIVARSGGLIRGTSFSGNNAVFGGAVITCCGPMRVENSTFRGNHASWGGGLHTTIGALSVVNSEFYSNNAVVGGGLYTSASNYAIKNCRFGFNSAAQNGGGLHLTGAGTVANCTFVRNFASSSGGGVYTTQASNLVNNTFYSNTALAFGGGLLIPEGNPTVRNSIFWANNDSTGQSQSAQINRVSGSASIAYNIVQGWNGTLGGVGNFSDSPHFVDPAGPDGVPGTADDNLRLSVDSPGIDAGDNSALPADLADLNGNGNTTELLPLDLDLLGRVHNGYVDLGAYEWREAPPPPPWAMWCQADVNNDGSVNGADLAVLLAEFGNQCESK